MATRCQIALYSETPTTKDEVLGKWDVLLYHHWDGYPSYMLKLLRDWLAYFKQERGLWESDYLGAYLMYHWKKTESENREDKWISLCTSHGIDKDFHADIEYLYCISAKEINVYRTNFWDEKNMMLLIKYTIDELLVMSDPVIEDIKF